MNLGNNKVIYEAISGSRAYGTSIEGVSDTDIKGIFIPPAQAFFSLNPIDDQINDSKHDIVYYCLKKFFELASKSNPNLIEMLWYPKDCVLKFTKEMSILMDNRHLFISKQAYSSHIEYARGQIKRSRGKNKKVHNPQPKERPRKEDFVRIILINDLAPWWECDQLEYDELEEKNKFPLRPAPLKDVDIDLSEYHIAALEHVPNTYRLYYYGKGARGVFRGNDMLVCESIPKADEWHKIVGLMIYDQNEYDKAVKEWHSYWEWKNNSNPNRWKSQAGGEIDYDVKNMQHSFRLLYSGLNILNEGAPIVRCDGELLQFLRDIRNEKFSYEELMEKLGFLEKNMDQAFEKSNLPEYSDMGKLDELYGYLVKNGEKFYGKI